MIAHLGVVDVAYSEDGKTTTTGDVAEILEANYGVMRTFVELHEKDIANELSSQLMGMLESAKQGAPLPLGSIQFPKIDAMFRDYLDHGEWEKTSGQPTQAAQNGVRTGKKRPYKKSNSPRPSFIDTGLYRGSFKTRVDRMVNS